MKKYIILFIIALNGLGLKGQTSYDFIKVSLSGPSNTIVYGSEITFKVRYLNNAKEPITILKPDSSFYCSVGISPSFKKNCPSTSFGFGKSFLVQNFDSIGNIIEEYAVVAPSGTTTIFSDKYYEFSFNMLDRIKDNFALLEPTTYSIDFHDGKLNKSIDTRFTLIFTEESISYLINFLDGNESRSIFEMVKYYLMKIKLDIKLTYVKPDDKDYEEKSKSNMKEIGMLKEYLKNKENKQIIKKSIKLINKASRK